MRLIKICLLFLSSLSSLTFASGKPGLAQMVTNSNEVVNKESTTSDPFSAMKTTEGEKPSVVSPQNKVLDVNSTEAKKTAEVDKDHAKKTDSKINKSEAKKESLQHQTEDKKTNVISKEESKPKDKKLDLEKQKQEAEVQKQAELKKQELEEHEAQLKQQKQIQEHEEKVKQQEHVVPEQPKVEQPNQKPLVAQHESEEIYEQESEEDQMIESSLDTIDALDEGNWVLKRVWWEQAEAAFEKIIQLNDKIMQLQMNLVTDRNNHDREFNNLFKQIGLEQNQIVSFIDYLLEANLSEDDQKSKEEYEILDKVESKKADFEKIKEDLTKFVELDNLISESLIQLMQLVNKCRDYETKSWEDFKEIGRVLNDEKAKELFYEVEADYKNVESIYNYINSELHNYMNSNLNEMGVLAKDTVDALAKLDDEDLSLKSLVEKHKEAVETKKRLAELKEQEALNKKAQPKKSKGFFSGIANWFSSLWKSIKGIFGIK